MSTASNNEAPSLAPGRGRPQFNCMKGIAPGDVNYEMVDRVIRSWGRATREPSWKEKGGELLVRKMFEANTTTKIIFGVPLDADYADPELLNKYPSAKMKGIIMMESVNNAVGFLGPDLSPLEGTLYDFGRRHYEWQVQAHHFPAVGEALFYFLETSLGDSFCDEERESWNVMYCFLSYNMIQGLLAREKEVLRRATRRFSAPEKHAATKNIKGEDHCGGKFERGGELTNDERSTTSTLIASSDVSLSSGSTEEMEELNSKGRPLRGRVSDFLKRRLSA